MTDLADIVAARRSVRGFFRDRPVPREVIERALRVAQLAPSNCNAQPWRVWILSGEARDSLSQAMCAAMDSGDLGNPEDPIDSFFDEYRRLQIACGAAMYGAMGIERGDVAGRIMAHRRNYELFDAPHVAIVAMDRRFGIGVAVDIGAWLQTFMLALADEGVGSCAQAALRQYPTIVRGAIGADDGMRLLFGVSFGYEDPSVPANATRQLREPLETTTTWLG